jgi:hypothetical protein
MLCAPGRPSFPGVEIGEYADGHRRFREMRAGARPGSEALSASPPGFNLLSHRLEVPFHLINTSRDAIDQRNDFEYLANTGLKTAVTQKLTFILNAL